MFGSWFRDWRNSWRSECAGFYPIAAFGSGQRAIWCSALSAAEGFHTAIKCCSDALERRAVTFGVTRNQFQSSWRSYLERRTVSFAAISAIVMEARTAT